MSKKFLAAVLAVLCVASFVAASGASAAEAEDTTPPELVGVSIEPSEVDVTEAAAKVAVTAHVTDELSGVSYVAMSFRGPGERPQSASVGMSLVEGTRNDGVFRGYLSIPRFAEGGKWKIGNVQIGDNVNNTSYLEPPRLEELGLQRTLAVVSKADTRPPELVGVSIEPSEVDVTEGAAKVAVTAHVTDDLSGVSYVAMSFRGPGERPQSASVGMSFVEGTRNDGVFRGYLLIPRFAEGGGWKIGNVRIGDNVNNTSYLEPPQLEELGLQRTLAVVSKADTQPPELLSLSIEPSEVDVTEAAAKVAVTAHVTDELSGVAYVAMNLQGPGERPQSVGFSLTLAEGTSNDGIFHGYLSIPRFAEGGKWEISNVQIGDNVNNTRYLVSPQLEELGLQRTVEVNERLVEEEPVESSPPQLAGLSFEPTEIDTTEAEVPVRVMAHIKSEAGLKQGYIAFHAPGTEFQNMEFFERVSGTEFDGEYEAKVLFPQDSEGGRWRAEVWLGDHAGRESRIGPEGLAERGLPSSVFVIDRAEEPEEEEPVESAPPVADELLFSPSEFDTSETKVAVNVFVHIDSEAGFAGGYVTFQAPNGEQTERAYLELQAGDEFSGAYSGEVTFPQGSEPGEWLAELTLSDSAGHEVALGPEQLIERGLPYEVTVLKPTSPPVVTGISPSSGPETGGTLVHLVGSGFGGVTAVHFGGSLAEFVYESPESITAYAPPGTANVGVAVTTPAGTSGEVNYAYTPSAVVTLISSLNPSVRGQKVTFTAMVEPAVKGGSTPLGTVTFREGTTTLGVVNLSKGKATLNTTTLGAGEHPVVAEYSGDSHYGAASSSPVTQVVAKATTELTLASSLNPAPFGASGTLKAHVAAVAPGAGIPAGTVTFREGETVLGTVQLSGGNASLSLKSLAPGEHAISAAYSGDANDKASESATVKQVVTKASTELALTSTLNPAPFGSSATLKATVKALTPGGGTPSGTVTFREGETVLSTVPLSAGSAKYVLKTTAPGEHEFTATYSGEADYESSSGGIVQAIVVASTELTLTSSKNPAPHGSSGTLKATVKTIAPGGGTPAGTVTFREGETVLAIIPLSSGSATYPLKALSIGEHKITATYSGNADYGASESTIGQVITS